ncbi:MAG: hypothetical protein NTV94_10730 [Planctomycetota bacterium]|nr:hypothetical protein [Planctomycetota bacterium]
MIRAQSVSFLLALAAGSGIALAQASRTLLNLQVSRDGVNWSNDLTLDPSIDGGRVLMRASVSWSSSTTTVPIGFASLTWQPVISGVSAGDSIAAFANAGNNTNGGGVDPDGSPLDGPFGRIRPFAATGPSGLQNYVVHRHTNGSGDAPAGSYLRIARNDVTRWMGTGVTTGTAAVNNFNGAGGIATVQKGAGQVGTLDPAFRSGITDIAIFQLALNLANRAPGETSEIGISAPLEGTSRDSTTGARRGTWYSSTTDNFGSIAGDLVVTGAVVHLVPTPAAISLLFSAGLVASTRRRNERRS